MARAPFHLLDVRTLGTIPEGDQPSQRIPHLVRIKDREREALKLRRKGWSYRRIAETLQVQYVLVSRWLSGLDQPLVRGTDDDGERIDVSRAAAALSRDATADLRALAARYDRLESRVDDIANTVDDLKKALSALQS